MTYRLLTKEQFEALHQEFATFLAVQEIDKTEWEIIKTHHTEKVDELLAQFSDLVWTEVLEKAYYLEHFSKDSINLFYCGSNSMHRIVVRIEKPTIDLLQKTDFEWFINHSDDNAIHYFKGDKKYSQSRNEEIFKLIEEGAVLSDGKLYNAINEIIHR